MRFDGKVAVVTGAASGIGAATAVLLAERGAFVAAVDRDAAGLTETLGRIRKAGGAAEAYEGDVTDEGRAMEICKSIASAHRPIAILATCAGVSSGRGTVLTQDAETWDRVWRINVMGTVNWVKSALPSMIAAKSGSIVTVASQLAFNSGGNACAYIASKGAIVSFTKTTAVDFAKDGIRVNTVAPAVIETPLSEASKRLAPDPAAMQAWRVSRHPVGRIGQPLEVARAIAFLASDEASFTTGSVHFVDGGWTAS